MAGNAGNAGNAGGVGAIGGATAVLDVLPDRIDLPFVTVDDPPGMPIAQNLVDIHQYPLRCWSGEWRAWYALSQYAASGWQAITVAPWIDTPANTQAEIDALVVAARDERADALGEIVAQNEEFASYFLRLLTINPADHPATYRLICLASIVATFTVLHFKGGVTGGVQPYFPRPRPSQVCPALLPPVPVPCHASYPSGHATEARLIALVLEDILQPVYIQATIVTDLTALSWRIARNREIAGLHYPSDSHAGRILALDILPYLQGINEYQAVLTVARAEWP
jgi:membrane-associated phospholipid phosphatase